MSLRYATGRAIVYCERCSDHPVLPTHLEDADTRKCIRCQGENRWLPEPHPDDHLCRPCRRECPTCQAATPRGGQCRACRGLCRTCSEPLPDRGPAAAGIVHVPPERRKDHRHRFERTYFPRSWDWDQCDACQEAARGKTQDPVRTVLAALPDKVVRACGGAVPPSVVDTIHEELQHTAARQLAARVERRWWTSWAARPLKREEKGHQAGYQPDDVALWLLTPTSCAGRCEDGWHLADKPGCDDVPCTVCKGGQFLNPRHDDGDDEAESVMASDRTTAEAVAYRPPMRECTGQGGACGVPVAAPYGQCPACLDWPWCKCHRRRYDPSKATACTACSNRGLGQ